MEQITINNLGVGRSVDEALRLLQGFQFHAAHGEVCPAGWVPGAATMKPDANESQEYFQKVPQEEDVWGNVEALTAPEAYRDVTKSGLVVVDYYATWCGKCRQIAPFIETLQKEFAGTVKFFKVDTDAPQMESLTADVSVKTLPAFKLYKDGRLVDTVFGYKKKVSREAWLSALPRVCTAFACACPRPDDHARPRARSPLPP